jgi:hypothetical protein
MTHTIIEIAAGFGIAIAFYVIGLRMGRGEMFQAEIPGIQMTKKGDNVVFKVDRAELQNEHVRMNEDMEHGLPEE